MKSFRSNIQKASMIAALFAAAPSFAEGALWLARPTGNLSCAEGAPRLATLGRSVAELEDQALVVKEAKVARIAGRMTCMACHCLDGSYNVVKVQINEELDRVMEQGGWEEVSAEEITPSVDANPVRSGMRILPVGGRP